MKAPNWLAPEPVTVHLFPSFPGIGAKLRTTPSSGTLAFPPSAASSFMIKYPFMLYDAAGAMKSKSALTSQLSLNLYDSTASRP